MNEHNHSTFLKKLIGVALLLLMLLSTLPLQTVLAQSAQGGTQATITLNDLGYTSDVEYQGVLVSHQYDVNLPQNWTFSAPLDLTIHFSHSHSLNAQSSLSVDWNDVRVGSTLLTTSNADDGSLEIQVPSELLVAGYNKLTLQFYMGIRDDFCEDFDNPAVWAVVKNITTMTANYTFQAPVLDLHNLPTILVDPSPEAVRLVTLVLPAAPTIADLNAAALISAKLGQLADWRTLTLKTLSLDQVKTTAPTGNVIFIGSLSELSAAFSQSLPATTGAGAALQVKDASGAAVAADSGVLWLQASPNDPNAIWLTVTGANEAALQKAASAFATTSAYDRLSGQMGVVLSVPASAENVQSAPTLSYSLSDLGYKDIVASGSRQQSTYLTLPLQLVFASQGEAILNLNFSHSTALNADRSSLDILVNNVPVSSVGLSDQNANNATAAVKIPLRLFKLGDNTITLTSNLQVNKSAQASTLYCTDKYYSDSWLTVSPTTTLSFPSGIGEKTASLAGFPNLYLGSADMSSLAVVVPEKPDWTTASAVLQSINRLGRTAKGNQLAVAVVSAAQQAQISAQRPYQILVGLPSQNKAIQQLNELLPQPFESDWVTPKALNGEIAIAPSASGLGYIQSLYTKEGQYRLVLTATSANGLSWVASLIDTPTTYKDFEGNLAVLTRSDEAAFYKIASQTSLVSDQPAVTATTAANQYNQFPDWVFWLAIVIFLAALVSLLVIRVMRNRK